MYLILLSTYIITAEFTNKLIKHQLHSLCMYLRNSLNLLPFPVLLMFVPYLSVPLRKTDLHVGERQRERFGKCLHLSLFPSL